ncbi:hypothetical protein [Rugamonas sp.]|uniref:hypothetical protein n=1 Tax=Rugamonas sp. TaxID=1926287 RepID=UPI0025DFCEB6|nr:hypothetical protein [Rugamonas sp.]
MRFRILVKGNDDVAEKEITVEVAVSLKMKFGKDEAAKKLGIPVSEIVKVTRVS